MSWFSKYLDGRFPPWFVGPFLHRLNLKRISWKLRHGYKCRWRS
jgi:hypothetical protein